MVTSRLPFTRRALLWFATACGVGNFIASGWLMSYQLLKTSGYTQCVPAIIVSAFLSFTFPAWFLYMRPLPGRWDFLRSIMLELITFALIAALALVSVADLHADTPGLLGHCGGFPMCKLLAATMACTWLCVLSLGLEFTCLLLGVLYFAFMRKIPIATVTTAFDQVDWAMYKERKRRSRHMMNDIRQDSHGHSHSPSKQLPAVPMEKVFVDDTKSEMGVAL